MPSPVQCAGVPSWHASSHSRSAIATRACEYQWAVRASSLASGGVREQHLIQHLHCGYTAQERGGGAAIRLCALIHLGRPPPTGAGALVCACQPAALECAAACCCTEACAPMPHQASKRAHTTRTARNPGGPRRWPPPGQLSAACQLPLTSATTTEEKVMDAAVRGFWPCSTHQVVTTRAPTPVLATS